MMLVAGVATIASAQPQRVQIPSRVFGHARPVDVSLPRGYDNDSTARYPVIFVLDGESLGELTAATVRFYSSTGVMPRAIVVAVPNDDRNRDFTPAPVGNFTPPTPTAGGADRFVSFLESDVMPALEQRYRTLPFRVLIGHSLGGLFAAHAAAERPGLFNAFVIMEPSLWWNNEEPLRRLQSAAAQPASKRARFIMVNAPLPANDTTSWGGERPMVRSLTIHGESHESMPARGIAQGLRLLFADFQPPAWKPGTPPIAMLARAESLDYRLGVHVPIPLSTYTRAVRMSMNARLFDDAELALRKMEQAGVSAAEIAELRGEVAEVKSQPADPRLIPLVIPKQRPTAAQAARFLGTWRTIGGGDFTQELSIRASNDTIAIHSRIRQRGGEPYEEDNTVIRVTPDGTLEWGRQGFINLAALMIQKATLSADGTMLIREEPRGWVIRDPGYTPREMRMRRVP
jgi:predicted alpha/beta superfamily hydrolase